jgi:hypothetical protein
MDEDEQSQSLSDDQFDPSEDTPRQARKQPIKRSSPVFKRGSRFAKQKPGRPRRRTITFESHLSTEETEQRICQVLGSAFHDAAVDEVVLSDRLSVKDVRIILRVLSLVHSDQINSRKHFLIEKLQDFLRSDHMTDVYAKYLDEVSQAEARKEADKKKRSTVDETDSTESPERSSAYAHRTLSLAKKRQEERAKKVIVIPRLRYDQTFDVAQVIDFLKDCNDFVLQLSDRLSEMERAVCILMARIGELEEYYQV